MKLCEYKLCEDYFKKYFSIDYSGECLDEGLKNILFPRDMRTVTVCNYHFTIINGKINQMKDFHRFIKQRNNERNKWKSQNK